MIRSAAIVFLAIWLLSLLIFRSAGFNDPGTFWHTRVGEIILDSGTFPRTDPFTFPFEGQLWIPQQWLAEIGMALVYRSAGMDGQLLALATLLAGLHAWAYSRLRMAGVPAVIAGFLAVAAWFAGLFHDLIRPHMVTLLLTAWTAARLVDFDRGRIGLRGLAMLIPIFVLWTNLHGGVLGGMMMLGFAAAGWFAGFFLKRSSPIRNRNDIAWVILIGIVCGLSALVNPFGMEMIRTWQRIVGSTAMKQFVPEHQPLDPFDSSGKAILIVFGCYVLLVLTTRLSGFRITWLIPAIWFTLSLNGIRQGPLCIVTSLILAADVWPHSAIGRALTTVTIPKPSHWGWSVPFVAVLLSFTLQATNCNIPLIGRNWARLDESRWPVSLEPVLRSVVERVPAGTRIYNDTYFGGYLIRFAPELKIFTDDRFELTGDEWIRRYVETVNEHPERFDDWQKQYGFRFALVQTGPEPSPLERHLLAKPNEWKEIGRHPAAVLFEFNEPFRFGIDHNW
jgi:hypothetical protein